MFALRTTIIITMDKIVNLFFNIGNQPAQHSCDVVVRTPTGRGGIRINLNTNGYL